MKTTKTIIRKTATALSLIAVLASACKKGGSGSDGSTPPTPLSVTTGGVTALTSASAVCNATLNSTGGDPAILYCGVVWDTDPHPTVGLVTNTIVPSTSKGNFSATLTGLTGGTTYYARSYVNGSHDFAYGNEITFTTPPSTIAIGQSYAGGMIFYIDNTKAHGFVVSPIGAGGSQWAGNNNATVLTSTALGTGRANTDAIIKAFGKTGTYIALSATQIKINGYSDWFMPSKDEISQIQHSLPSFAIGDCFSSSTDGDGAFAWKLVNGAFTKVLTVTYIGGTRPIRAF